MSTISSDSPNLSATSPAPPFLIKSAFFSISVENVIAILAGIALNMWIALGNKTVLMIRVLPVHFLVFLSTSLTCVLKFSL